MKKHFIKICGITRIQDALFACEHGVDALGFIATQKSKRFILPEKVETIIKEMKLKFPMILRVGVFVNELPEKIIEYIKSGINVVQIHGNETPEMVSELKKIINSEFQNIEFWKAIPLKNSEDLNIITEYDVDKILIDAYKPGLNGGTGKLSDWKLAELAVNTLNKPIILAGGLNWTNINEAINSVKPYGVDLSSGVEDFPGIKNQKLIKKLFSVL